MCHMLIFVKGKSQVFSKIFRRTFWTFLKPSHTALPWLKLKVLIVFDELVLISWSKDFANYKDNALEIYPTIVYACTVVQLYFDFIGYFGCLRV